MLLHYIMENVTKSIIYGSPYENRYGRFLPVCSSICDRGTPASPSLHPAHPRLSAPVSPLQQVQSQRLCLPRRVNPDGFHHREEARGGAELRGQPQRLDHRGLRRQTAPPARQVQYSWHKQTSATCSCASSSSSSIPSSPSKPPTTAPSWKTADCCWTNSIARWWPSRIRPR